MAVWQWQFVNGGCANTVGCDEHGGISQWLCGDSVGCVDGGTAMAVGRWRCSSGGGAMTVV